MGRTMKWPPTPEGGRIPFVEGLDASTVLVVQTLSDLQTNPFNDPRLSLGDITFRTSQMAIGRISGAITRLKTIVEVIRVIEVGTKEENEDGERTYVVEFIDRETRQPSQVVING